MLLYTMLYIVLAYLMLFAALTNSVCLNNASFFFLFKYFLCQGYELSGEIALKNNHYYYFYLITFFVKHFRTALTASPLLLIHPDITISLEDYNNYYYSPFNWHSKSISDSDTVRVRTFLIFHLSISATTTTCWNSPVIPSHFINVIGVLICHTKSISVSFSPTLNVTFLFSSHLGHVFDIHNSLLRQNVSNILPLRFLWSMPEAL